MFMRRIKQNLTNEGRFLVKGKRWRGLRAVRRMMYWAKSALIVLSPNLFWQLDQMVRRQYFEPEVELLPWLCDREKTSIDVGANFGAYLSYMGVVSKNCIGFEPVPHLSRLLQSAWWPHPVQIYDQALSDQSAVVELREPKYHVGYSTICRDNVFSGKIRFDQDVAVHRIRTSRLDDYQLTEVGFIKIDVEGHEYEVLQGARQTILASRPNLLVEIEERHRLGSLHDVVLLLAQ